MNKHFLAGLAGLHLLVLALGIIPNFPPATWPRAQAIRDLYQSVTGAGGGFGFFSPGLGNELQIRFETVPPQAAPLALTQMANGEVALRLGNMARLLGSSFGEEDKKRAVAASLAAAVFRRYPGTREVTLIASIYTLPSMQAWAAGERPSSREAYRATFRLGAK